jgi:hypothetical protein
MQLPRSAWFETPAAGALGTGALSPLSLNQSEARSVSDECAPAAAAPCRARHDERRDLSLIVASSRVSPSPPGAEFDIGAAAAAAAASPPCLTELAGTTEPPLTVAGAARRGTSCDAPERRDGPVAEGVPPSMVRLSGTEPKSSSSHFFR